MRRRDRIIQSLSWWRASGRGSRRRLISQGLDCLESRVLPASVTIVSTPGNGTVTGVGKVTNSTSQVGGLPVWQSDAAIKVPLNAGLGTRFTGTYSVSGDLVLKVVAGPGEAAGDPVRVTVLPRAQGWVSLDPLGPAGSDIVLKVGHSTADEILSATEGYEGQPQYGSSSVHFDTLNYVFGKQIDTTIGSTLTIHVVHTGSTDVWYDFSPAGLETGGEVTSNLTVQVAEVKSLLRELQVLSSDDDIEDEKIFGPYLGGVNLPVEFDTVDPFVHDSPIKTVKVTLDGVTRSTDEYYRFTFNVGSLTPGDHTLRTAAYDANNKIVGRSPEMKIRVIKQLNFELQVQEKPGTLVDDVDARFFSGVKGNLTFVGTVTALPTYYRDTFDVHANARIGTTAYEVSTLSKWSDKDYRFTFNADLGSLPVGKTNVDFVLGGILETSFGDQPEYLEVVKAPTWLSSSKPVFDSATGQYKWTDAKLGEIKVEAPQAPPSGQGWVDDTFKKSMKKGLTKSGASVTAFVSVQAPISIKEKPTYNNPRLEAQASLLGKTILPLTKYGTGAVKIDGTLDPKTLDPTGFGVQLTQPIQVAQFQLTDSHKVKVDLLNKVAPGFEWLLDISAIGQVGPTVGTVRINAGIGLTKSGDQVVLDSAKSFVGFANSTLEGSGSVGLKVQVLKGYVLDASAAIYFKPKITVDLDVHFKGAVSSPQFSNVNFVVAGQLGYKATVTADSKLNPGKPKKWESGDQLLGPYKLVDYHG